MQDESCRVKDAAIQNEASDVGFAVRQNVPCMCQYAMGEKGVCL